MQHLETTGERTRWTNAIFSGMPTYQIAPTYSSDAVMKQLQNLFELGTDGVLSYVFLYLIGFYFLLRTFGLKPQTSVLGAIAWAFSSYFFIIISAGHIWKVLTLTFVPPTIAGLILCYRGKLLWGMGVTAMFAALQIYNNHVQMSYYFAFLMAFIVACCGVASLRKKAVADAVEGIDDWVSALTPRKWLKATGAIVVAGLIGVSANLPNLYHTYTYAKESMRGKAELTPFPSQQHAPTEGLDRDYITQWSYGIGETMTLLIPDFKGGGSRSIFERADVEKLDGYDSYRANAYQFQQMTGGQMYPPGIMEYWGDQPFTVGPVYVGAIICFFFVLGAFIVVGPLKWALLLATGLSLLFAWGKNFMPATDFFIDYIPMYNKFRTVSSALVVAEFTMPLLAVLALAKVLRRPNLLLNTQRGKVGFGVATIGAATWLAENLDYKFDGCGISTSENPIAADTTEPSAWYYDEDEAQYGLNGTKKCGLLYNWYAIDYLEQHKDTLIPGWHVPTTAEWDALATAVGGTSVAGTKLKSTTDWSSGAGTDDYGFSALPAGNYNGSFNNLGSNANFWTATENNSSNAYNRNFNTGASMNSNNNNKNNQYSVRLVKDSE